MSDTSKRSPALVLVGMCGSGKSAAAEYLRNHGWQYLRFGQVTIDELRRRGLPVTEDTEREIREEIRATHGMDAYAKLLWPRIQAARAVSPVAIDGLYSWSEYKFLKQLIGEQMFVVAIVAAREIRYRRLAFRPIRPLSRQEAEARDVAEIEHLEKGGPIAMADYTVVNDESIDDLACSLTNIADIVRGR